MESNPFAKQTLQIYHAALTQTFDAILAVQDQSQRTIENLLDQTPGIPAEGKRAIRDWIEACRQQTDALRSVINGGFKPFHRYYEE